MLDGRAGFFFRQPDGVFRAFDAAFGTFFRHLVAHRNRHGRAFVAVHLGFAHKAAVHLVHIHPLGIVVVVGHPHVFAVQLGQIGRKIHIAKQLNLPACRLAHFLRPKQHVQFRFGQQVGGEVFLLHPQVAVFNRRIVAAVFMLGQFAVRPVVVVGDALHHIRHKLLPARQLGLVALLLGCQFLALPPCVKRAVHLAVEQVLRASVHTAAGKGFVLRRQPDQVALPPSFDDAAPLRVARQAGFMVDTQPCGQAGDFMVDGFAGLAAAVVGVVHQRHTVVLDTDAQRIRYRHTAFGERKTKSHHHAHAAVDNHGYLGFKRLAVDRVLHFGLKAVAVADPHIIWP